MHLVDAPIQRLVLYRHEAQVCHCGEPNCTGVLGGKTQTDVAAMDDLYLDGTFSVLTRRFQVILNLPHLLALGISDEVERYGLKGNKKKKSKQLDEDYVVRLNVSDSLRTAKLFETTSLSSNLCKSRMSPRLCKQSGKHRARRSC